jgi:hypothetical protein
MNGVYDDFWYRQPPIWQKNIIKDKWVRQVKRL